jgi:hypothetical protein
MAGNRTCDTRVENDTQRSFCYGDNTAKVQIFERPWHDSVLFVRNCICNSMNSTLQPITYVSSGREVEVHFTAINMTRYDEPDTLNFQATFEFIKPSIASKCKDSRRKLGSEGIIRLNEAEVIFPLNSLSLTYIIDDCSAFLRMKKFFFFWLKWPFNCRAKFLVIFVTFRMETKKFIKMRFLYQKMLLILVQVHISNY